MTGLSFDFDGNPISYIEWAMLFERAERHVAVTAVGDEIEVSTIWLGLDYSFGLGGPPLIYESMVFGGELAGQGCRYPNRDAALAGHDQLVAAVREAALRGVAADICREFGFDE